MGLFSRKSKEDKSQPKAASWSQRLKGGLGKTSSRFSEGLKRALVDKKLDESTLEELEDALIMTDMGVSAVTDIIETISREKFDKEITVEEVKEIIANRVADILTPTAKAIECHHTPEVILLCGVNGSGKTTTIGKLAKRYQDMGKQVVIAACDTFRAAAVEQLAVWAERSGAHFIQGERGADAASVAYRAVEYAHNNQADIVLIDTAGRLENKQNLMEELTKMVRVIQKLDNTAPHQRIIVLDATTGQNAIQQVKVFSEKAELTGVVVTKLDGTAKGGVVVNLAKQFALPIHAVGVGEAVEDLDHFDPMLFAKNLVDQS